MPEPDDARPIAIRCGGLLDVEAGTIERDRVIHVGGDGRITAVGGPDDGTPDGAALLDLGGLTVLPGPDRRPHPPRRRRPDRRRPVDDRPRPPRRS